MTLNAVFLEGVYTELTALAKALGRQETSACELLKVARDQVEVADTNWVGPRADKVVTDSTTYLTAADEYPRAVSSGQTTISRWAVAAHKMAEDMALQEVQMTPQLSYSNNEEERKASDDAELEIERLQGAWGRICMLFANELDDSITAINKANGATGIAIDSGQATSLRAELDLAGLDGPAAVRLCWDGLTDEEKLTLLATYPGLLGNLDGLPAKDRDIANRTQLIKDLDRLEELEEELEEGDELSYKDKRELANIRNVLKQLQNGDAYEDPVTGEPVPCQLYIYDPAAFGGDGRIAISTGDLDSALQVAVTVPGFTTNVAGMSNNSAQSLYDETRWASEGSVAVLNWQGYNTPDAGGMNLWNYQGVLATDTLGVAGGGKADDGAALLASDVEGLNGIRNPNSDITVVAHSYGSTTASIAADEHGMTADNLVLIGSPGTGNADSADDFENVGNVYVGAASNDPVTDAIIHGDDPAHEDWDGGTRFTAETDEPSWVNGDKEPLPSHTAYYTDGSESLYNISSVVAGEGDQVNQAPDRQDEPHVQFGLSGPPGIQQFPSIEFDIDGITDPEGDREPTSGHTHQPLLPGGPTQAGQRIL